MEIVLLLLLTSLLQTPQAGQQSESVIVSQSEAEESSGKVGELNSNLSLDPVFRFELEDAIRRKDLTRAEELLAREIESNPDAPHFELLNYLGGIFFYDKKYLNAAIAFQKAEAISPIDPGNRFTLAMSYILLGRSDWAQKELGRLVQEVPGNPLFPYWLARIDFDNHAYDIAIQKLQELTARFPDYVKAWDRLALCYEALGRTEEAIAHYEKAVELNRNQDPAWSWPALNLGTLLIQVGDPGKAQKYLEEAIQIDPMFPQAHYKLGLAYEKLEKFEESVAALQMAAELDPDYAEPYWALSRVLRRTGDREGAQAAVETYQQLVKSREAKKD